MLYFRQIITISISLILLHTSLAISSKVETINLNADWQLEVLSTPRQPQDLLNKKLHTNIPTTLHLDLIKHQKIVDPFYRNNWQDLKWLAQCKVKYSKKFKIQQDNANKYAELIFHGVDTYAQIKLNGIQIIQTKNAFRKYIARVEKILKKNQQNILEVEIQSTDRYDNEGQQKDSMPFRYAHTRKACYQYSWDWAPEMITMGIWKDVDLVFFEQMRIDYVWVRNRVISQQKVTLNFATKFDVQAFKDEKLSDGYKIEVVHNGVKLGQKQVHEDTSYLDIDIKNPKFWWPNGIGQPHIYDFEVNLYKDQVKIDIKQIPYGIRTSELDLTDKKFKIKINNLPVYCKGANYVPMDMLHPRITNKYHQNKDYYTYEKLFDDAIQSNFNMIRLWGGGQYETDEFLEMASRKGIMIFYDFMFSDSIYPSTAPFLENVEEEVKQQVRRARNYPALVLWCGNNEILQGVQDWGWSSTKYRKDYEFLFEKLIRKIIQIENPQIPYIPSSPLYGVGNYGFERGGDVHYWGVWAGGAVFQSYENAVGAFNSEFGTQALPVWHTVKQFTAEQDRKYESRQFLSHERHNSQFGTLKNYINQYMNKSKNFENQVYISGVLQAYAVEVAIRAQRSSKPQSYGTLYWQFNDAWPAISWAAIDYYGRWKPLQYMAKRSYPNIAIFTHAQGKVVGINDNLYPVDVIAKVFLIKFDGTVLMKEEKSFTLQADSVLQLFNINKQLIQSNKNEVVALTQIFYRDTLQMQNTRFFTKFKQLLLPKAILQVKYNNAKNQIKLSSDKLIKNVFIDHKNHYIHLSDNYFDLVPGFPITVQLMGGYNLAEIKDSITFTSLRQASQQEQLQIVKSQQ